MELLAFLYSDTPFSEFNDERSIYLFGTALKTNSFDSMVFNGIDLYVQDRYKESFEVFNKLQEIGSGTADFYLGLQYLNGAGVDRDLEKARMLFRKKKSSWVYSYLSNNILSGLRFYIDNKESKSGFVDAAKDAGRGYGTAQAIVADQLIKSGDKDYALLKSWLYIYKSNEFSLTDVDEKYLDGKLSDSVIEDADYITKKWFEAYSVDSNTPLGEASLWCKENAISNVSCFSGAIKNHIECTIDIHHEVFSEWYGSEGYSICRTKMNNKNN